MTTRDFQRKRKKIAPVYETSILSAWSENNDHHHGRKLKDIVADFGLSVPYNTDIAPEGNEVDYENEIINCNRIPTNSFLNIGSKYREYQLLIDVENTDSNPKRTKNNLSKILIDGALRLKSVFQCITFKREDVIKRDFTKDKSSLGKQNYDISLEHLESSQVIYNHNHFTRTLCSPNKNNVLGCI